MMKGKRKEGKKGEKGWKKRENINKEKNYDKIWYLRVEKDIFPPNQYGSYLGKNVILEGGGRI